MKCPKTQLEYDFLVIGSGLSGLSFALKAAEFGRVALVSKSQIPEGNSLMAQGGIAASLNGEEEIRSHIEDTLRAGSGLCRPEVVEEAVRKSSQCIGDLQSWGVEFDRKGDGDFDLHKEGGHSHRRIFHIGDHTGSDIISTLIHRIKNVDNIDLFENHMAIDLILNKKVQPFFFGQGRNCRL